MRLRIWTVELRTYRFCELICMPAKCVHVSESSWSSAVTEYMHDLVDTFRAIVVETVVESILLTANCKGHRDHSLPEHCRIRQVSLWVTLV